MPHPTGPAFQIDFDFVDHRLDIVTVDRRRRSLPLAPRSVADFYAEVMRLLDELDVATEIWPMPVEIPGAIPFPDDRSTPATTRTRSSGSGWRWSRWSGCSRCSAPASSASRARCTCSGAPSTSPTPGSRGGRRLRIRAAPRTAGRTSCGRRTPTRSAAAATGRARPARRACSTPTPTRSRPATATRSWRRGARWDDDLGEFVLPYELVRTAGDPDALLLEFLQSTYEAAATTAGWDRDALERPNGARDHG